MINFEQGQSYTYPYPYMVVENCFEDNVLNNLINEFPDVSNEGTVMGGRKKMNVNDPKFYNWIQTAPTWNQFYQWLNHNTVFDSILDYYKEPLFQWGSNLTENSSLSNDCFTHIDWSSSTDGYTREIHRDTHPRIWNFLLFFNDKNWDGGDFVIHSSDNASGNLPHQVWNPNALPVYKTIEAKKNLGVFFLSTPNSYHSVTKQYNTKSPRKFIYGSYTYKNGDVFKKRFK